MPLVNYDLGCELGSSVCWHCHSYHGNICVWPVRGVGVCNCAQSKGGCLCACMHIRTADACAFFFFFLLFSCVHVEADGSRFGWRRLGTCRSAETCLCVGSRGAGAAAAPSQPDCTPAAIPNASATALAGCAPALFLPALRLGKNGSFFLWIYFIPASSSSRLRICEIH